MKKSTLVSLLFLSWFFSVDGYASGFKLSSAILHTHQVEFLKYEGSGPWDNYLAMNIPFEPMADLFKQLLIKERRQLTNRGEAHITVVTPVEYWNILKPTGITMSEINQIAEKEKIQFSKFRIICLGKGSATVENKLESTYYVVVESDDLINLRRKIQNLYVSKGGNANNFKAEHFFSHITLGFTKRDLHESDGVIKDKGTCFSDLKLLK